jgi:hypothetical protein
MPKFWIGPMSKNVVDAILEFCTETGNEIGLIPSRRQIECDGGYVNNWTTSEFYNYIFNFAMKTGSPVIKIKRDHAGPGQGYKPDDGYDSLEHDCRYFDFIHIDPWKEYTKYDDGLDQTIKIINFCYSENPNLEYEIGTEQSIRKFSAEEVDMLLGDLKKKLHSDIFAKIKYVVVQSGTSLLENTNTGNYNSARLEQMVAVAKKYGKLAKEHNGDYLSTKLIKEKFNLGLDAINIAPEFGQIETRTYLEKIKEKPELLGKLFKICYISNRWRKWVDDQFIPEENQEQLINICGHYVLSSSTFLYDIKRHCPNIDLEIKKNIKLKLKELYA